MRVSKHARALPSVCTYAFPVHKYVFSNKLECVFVFVEKFVRDRLCMRARVCIVFAFVCACVRVCVCVCVSVPVPVSVPVCASACVQARKTMRMQL